MTYPRMKTADVSLLTVLTAAGAIAAGAAMLSTCSPHEEWTKCRMVHDYADKDPQGIQPGDQYDRGRWTTADGKTIGWSTYEDSRIWNTARCARIMPLYEEGTE